jgi:hypothetical protein
MWKSLDPPELFSAIHSFLTAEDAEHAEKNTEKMRFLTAEDAEGVERNAEKTSEAINPPSPIHSLFPSVFVSAPSASSAVKIFALLPTGIFGSLVGLRGLAPSPCHRRSGP